MRPHSSSGNHCFHVGIVDEFRFGYVSRTTRNFDLRMPSLPRGIVQALPKTSDSDQTDLPELTGPSTRRIDPFDSAA